MEGCLHAREELSPDLRHKCPELSARLFSRQLAFNPVSSPQISLLECFLRFVLLKYKPNVFPCRVPSTVRRTKCRVSTKISAECLLPSPGFVPGHSSPLLHYFSLLGCLSIFIKFPDCFATQVFGKCCFLCVGCCIVLPPAYTHIPPIFTLFCMF